MAREPDLYASPSDDRGGNAVENRPAGPEAPSLEPLIWNGQGDMVSEQASAMEWVKESHSRREDQAAQRDGAERATETDAQRDPAQEANVYAEKQKEAEADAPGGGNGSQEITSEQLERARSLADSVRERQQQDRQLETTQDYGLDGPER